MKPMKKYDPTTYKGKNILITGGSGFIGSNIIAGLLGTGANLTVLVHSRQKWNEIRKTFDKKAITAHAFTLVVGDIRDEKLMKKLVKNKDIIFNLASKVSHMDRGVISYDDLDINVHGQLILLEACRLYNPHVKIIFTSTRMVYGDYAKSPLRETYPTHPTTLYGIHKLTAEKYHLAYYKKHGIRSTILRIGNPYGDRQHMSSGLYSLPGWFMNRAMNGETIEILSDGKQKRDYIYIGDLVTIMLRTALTEVTNGKIYNAGSGISTTFGEMVDTIADTVETGTFVYADNPIPTHKTGDTYSFDISKLVKDVGWKPTTKLKDGVRRMYEFAKKFPYKK